MREKTTSETIRCGRAVPAVPNAPARGLNRARPLQYRQAPRRPRERFSATMKPAPAASPWELAAEAIAVKIRWFGLLVGYVLVNVNDHAQPQLALLNALLTLGVLY